ncbi:hypothetical protein R3P38DRAFT_3045181 [Favolaschia claudopus]|uniref:C2H2-type domain-containing protein n=1 Tax=Favolaschia claudopus TaxID=2862362 RepID=A0AAW0A7S6_9AGAR
MFEQTKKAAWDEPTANATCGWEGCSVEIQVEDIWDHIKTAHKFECRMADRELRCGWVWSDGKACAKKMKGSSMKKHVVNTHAKPTVFIQCRCGVSLQERGLRRHYGL